MSDFDLGPLPEKPSLIQLRKLAKELKSSGKCSTLAEAQFAIAKAYSYASWPKLKLHCEQTALQHAIKDDDGSAAQALFSDNPKLAVTPLPEGDLPLHRAAEWDAPSVVEAVMKAGANPNQKFVDTAHSALSWALTCWSYQAAEKMVALGHHPDLFCASGLGKLDLVKEFWQDGRLIAGASKTGSSKYDAAGHRLPLSANPQEQIDDALYIACRCGRLEVAKWLLDHSADPNSLGYAGASCLAWAEFDGNPELCALLRERGGSDDILDRHYQAPPKLFPIMIFAGWGFSPMRLAERFQANPALIHSRTDWGTPLHAAVQGGHAANVKLLLAVGVDRNASNANGDTALQMAIAQGNEEIIKLLND